MESSSFNEKKLLKEQFVSNLNGSSALEISTLITALSVLCVIRRGFGFNYSISGNVKKDDGNKNLGAYMAALLVDFLCIIVPSLLFITVLAEWSYLNAILVFFLLLVMIAIKRKVVQILLGETCHLIGWPRCLLLAPVSWLLISRYFPEDMLKQRPMALACPKTLISTFWFLLKPRLLQTVIMDLGVGSFIVTNSLVSRQARGISNMKLRNALFSASPLLILGFIRLISTSSVNYQLHVGEYGVHWNFFFTLAAVAILTSIFSVPPEYCGILGFFILVGYQVLLLSGLNEYLLSEDRKADLISQNKEGIYSIAGYWSMYLIGVQLGSYLFFGGKAGPMSITMKQAKTRVWTVCLLFWSIYFLLDWKVERASRRMSNMAYVFFVWAVNLQVLAVLMLSDYLPGCKTSALEEAVNRNMLAFFLVANVLTGVVNLSIDTLSVSPILALVILNAYLFVLSFALGLANFLGLKLKFW